MKRKILIFIAVIIFIAVAYTGFYIYKMLKMDWIEYQMIKKEAEDANNIAVAASSGNWDKVERMIYYSADVNVHNRDGATALMFACAYEKKEIIELLIEEGADVNAQDDDEDTALGSSIRTGNIEIIKLLIKNGADVNLPNNFGLTPLFLASKFDKNEIVELLIKNGADINVQDITGVSALKSACINKRYKMVRFLIENGADVDLRSHHGNAPIISSLIHNHLEIAKLLYTYIDVSKYTNTEKLMICSYVGDFDKVKELVLDEKTDPNASVNGYTALMGAVNAENMEIIDFLIEEGADPNVKNDTFGMSANDYAEKKGIDLN